jgi:hypothetical protein
MHPKLLVSSRSEIVFGNTVEAINLNDLGPLLHGCFPKTKFGMVLPEVERYLKGDPEDENPHYRTHIILFGMEVRSFSIFLPFGLRMADAQLYSDSFCRHIYA